jgi:hypothetical protein
MLNDITRNQLAGVWFAAVAIAIASVVATGVHVGTSTTALLLALCAVPPGKILALWRGASTQTIGEILYAEHTGREGRDELGAPKPEIARQKKEADDARAAKEKARIANKAGFRR